MRSGIGLLLAVMVTGTLCASVMAQENDRNNIDIWLKEGNELYENGSYEQAYKIYDKVTQIDPFNADAWLGKGNAVKILYKDPKDVNLYESIGRDPHYADAWAARGDLISTSGRLEEATDAYEKALQLYDERLKEKPRDIDAWLNKGHALDSLNIINYVLGNNESNVNAFKEEARQAYDKAIEINPESSEAWSAKAKGTSLSDYEALEAYKKAIELDPKNEEAWLGMANSFDSLVYKTNNKSFYKEAIESIDKALEINPGDSRTWSTEGYFLISQGKYKEATKAYKTALRLTPKDKLRWFTEDVLNTYEKVLERTRSKAAGYAAS